MFQPWDAVPPRIGALAFARWVRSWSRQTDLRAPWVSPCRMRLALLLGLALLVLGQVLPARADDARGTRRDLTVTTSADSGSGSLRQAILDANALEGPHTVRFDSKTGPFATPQTITLASELPELVGEVTIDGYIEGRLWQPSGVTLSGADAHRVFSVAPGARVTLSYLTITAGRAPQGAGMANRGVLAVMGVTFVGNRAEDLGGGLANLGGTLTVINSTFADNRAGRAGGGLADAAGNVTVTNSTFSGNMAPQGGGLFSSGTLLVRNTILANSGDGADCVATGALDPASTHNLIEANEGCGTPISTADPRLEALGGYNGPTPTMPLGGGSPAINLGDNASAVDEHGKPLAWDQRGNGDPRFVAGFTDLGAFEVQAFPVLRVNSAEDPGLRACTGARGDCSLRGAIELANATQKPDVITFDPRIFAESRTIVLTRPLPELTTDMTIDAAKTAGVTLKGTGQFKVFNIAPNARVRIVNITVEE